MDAGKGFRLPQRSFEQGCIFPHTNTKYPINLPSSVTTCSNAPKVQEFASKCPGKQRSSPYAQTPIATWTATGMELPVRRHALLALVSFSYEHSSPHWPDSIHTAAIIMPALSKGPFVLEGYLLMVFFRFEILRYSFGFWFPVCPAFQLFPASLMFRFSAFLLFPTCLLLACLSAFSCFSASLVCCFSASLMFRLCAFLLLCLSVSPLFCFPLLFCFSSFSASLLSAFPCLPNFLLFPAFSWVPYCR